MPIRLVIADDHPIVLDGLAQLFLAEPDMEVVARVSNGEQVLDAANRLRPDVLVLDLRMPGKDGVAVLRELKRTELPTRVVVLTALNDENVVQAIQLGAHGVALKDQAPKLIVECIRTVHAGGRWIEKAAAGRTIERLLERDEASRAIGTLLTPREIEVAQMIAQGLHTVAIAEQLSINEGTAKLHLHHIYAKLNVDGRIGLMRYMQSRGFA